MKPRLKKLLKSKSFWENVVLILIAAAFCIGFRITIQPYYIHGPSMEPNYQNNEWIWVNKLAYKSNAPQRGDIITFSPPPVYGSTPLIKRVIGLPGERVEIKKGTVYVYKTDGSMITMQEPYVKNSFTYSYTSSVIPENEYFVLGDNRDISEDSHYGWFVSRDKIIGKAWISIWPPSLWGVAPTYRQPATTPVTAGN
jgi:signal peptidase I